MLCKYKSLKQKKTVSYNIFTSLQNMTKLTFPPLQDPVNTGLSPAFQRGKGWEAPWSLLDLKHYQTLKQGPTSNYFITPPPSTFNVNADIPDCV